MSVPKLFYFSIRGYGEYIRLLLIDNGVKFEEHNFKYGSPEWAELKKTMTYGQVPFLKIDGLELVQTGAIMRYLGRKFELNGSNENETTFLDMFFEAVRDTRTKYVRYIFNDAEPRDQLLNVTIPEALEKIEAQFKVHPGDFIIGDKISYVDYLLFEELDVYNTLDAKILDKFPELKAFRERMWKRPNLKAYLEKRLADKVWINAFEKIL